MNDVTIESNPSQEKLDLMGVMQWPIWEKEVSNFPWHYDEREICYLLEGEVTVTTENGTQYHIKTGDLVTFRRGLNCYWAVEKPVRKHYQFG
ncbi:MULTISPECIES: cupin domain-containing protein [Piscirickettsiaceae]|jgi:uncharacterized cupin superfamily protein|uniref:DUF861 domain-containing protein n=1 Tax=Hydrogenovibrio thermophilus TaxID=265883 RepID=A0A410H2X0_9GAMM|nr:MULTISPECIES: cupin domain-containing protein [Piscirickettsiaceae]AZR82201.1 cupin [Thiomicrospira sp. S5]QAB15261.1 DUF861 domain-containing protein [Hydrogenovibrio thermophilus]